MARANYAFDKRQREALKKQKKLDKQMRKTQVKTPLAAENPEAPPVAPERKEPG